MAITRTAKGTASAYDDEFGTDRCELASVAIAEGASVIIEVAHSPLFSAPSSVTWNGLALALDNSALNASGVHTRIYSKHGCTAATGTASVIFGSAQIAAGVCIAVAQGSSDAGPLALDQISAATGLGVSPSSSATSTTTAADELLIGVVGDALAGLNVGGTWDNSFTDGQAVNDANQIALSEGYRIVAATGSYTASKSLATSGQWAACIATYKASVTSQTSTPSAVASVGAGVAGAGIAGAVTSTPAAVASTGAGVAGLGVPGAVVSTPSAADSAGDVPSPTSLEGVDVSQPAAVGSVGEVPTPVSFVVDGSYDPSAVTTLPVDLAGNVGMTLRPTTPATLGDQSRSSQEDSGLIIVSGSGDINLFATVIEDSIGAASAVSYLKLYAYVSTSDIVPDPNVYVPCISPKFILKVSGGARAFYDLASGSVPAAGVFDQPVWVSQNITTRPTGGDWTFPDIDNLVELGITAHYTLGSGQYTNLRLDEVWLEVWGPQGSLVPPIVVRLDVPQVRRLDAVEPVALALGAGSVRRRTVLVSTLTEG